jgi:hypothetical protein
VINQALSGEERGNHIRCPECSASLLGQHGVGCAWYTERLLEVIMDSFDDELKLRVVPRRAPRSAPPPDDPATKKHA